MSIGASVSGCSSVVDTLEICSLIAFCILTVVQQFDVGRAITLPIRRLGFPIPRWTFFGPKPVRSDFLIYYRDEISGVVGEFFELAAYQPSLLSLAWNPGRRIAKIVHDSVVDVVQHAAEENELTKLCTGNLVLCAFVLRASPLPPYASRQFAIVERTFVVDGHPTEQLLWLSDYFTA